MKVANIFGLVVAVHVIVLVLIFAIPGCRSSTKNPDAAMAQAMEAPPPATAYGSASGSPPPRDLSADLNPPLVARSASGFDSVSSTGGAGGRQSPTRPGGGETTGISGVSATPMTTAPAPQTYTVVRGDSLWSIAKKNGLTAAELARANNLSAEARLQLNQQLMIPARAAEETPTISVSAPTSNGRRPTPAANGAGNADAVTYEVRAGDTLGAIARRHNTTVGAIKTFNKLRSDLVRVGDKLMIPAGSASKAATTAAAPATTAAAPAAAAAAPAATTTGLSRAGGGAMKHVVAAGETLGQVARRYGVSIGALAEANNVTNPNTLRPGQELIIPGVTETAAANRPPEPTRYTPSYQPPATTGQPPSEPRTIDTSDPDNVPVIRVEEPAETIRIEPAPGGESQPPLFN